MFDTLHTLLRLRRLAVDEARRSLAARIGEQAAAEDALKTLDERIAREMEHACRPGSSDLVAEQFAAWLRLMRLQQDTAQRMVTVAQARTHEVRAVLSAGNAAVKAVEHLLQDATQAEQASAARRAQLELEDAARARPAPPAQRSSPA